MVCQKVWGRSLRMKVFSGSESAAPNSTTRRLVGSSGSEIVWVLVDLPGLYIRDHTGARPEIMQDMVMAPDGKVFYADSFGLSVRFLGKGLIGETSTVLGIIASSFSVAAEELKLSYYNKELP